jgi:FKBP-type peptidyl-prolyl cis-trans isomerase
LNRFPQRSEARRKIIMKSLIVATLCAGLGWSVAAADSGQFKDEKDKASYALGLNIGKQLKQIDAEIDLDTYLRGLKDGMAGKTNTLSDEEVRTTIMTWQQGMRTRSAEKKKKEGEAFLAENKKKEGVMVTPSGLQYKILTRGTGPVPTTNDTAVCHYRGTLTDGTEFDSSYKRGEPSSFPVTGVIKGWTEALLMMPKGSKWQLVIPSDLAYGDRGNPRIPGGSVLLFDIELVDIKKPEAAAAKPK